MLDIKKIYTTNTSGDLKITRYYDAYTVGVEFIQTGYRTVVEASNIRRGQVKDPFAPNIFGVGYMGVGRHKVSVKGKLTNPYTAWHSMLRRCYSPIFQEAHPTYKGCTVDAKWHNFQEFADWFEINYSDGLHLDKDIKVKGNRVYSPETCTYVTCAENNIEANAKRYKFINPEGDLVEVYNLKGFCKNNKLTPQCMARVHLGKQRQHKQWVQATTERVADFISALQAERNQLA